MENSQDLWPECKGPISDIHKQCKYDIEVRLVTKGKAKQGRQIG